MISKQCKKYYTLPSQLSYDFFIVPLYAERCVIGIIKNGNLFRQGCRMYSEIGWVERRPTLACLWCKMPVFQKVAMREGGGLLPLWVFLPTRLPSPCSQKLIHHFMMKKRCHHFYVHRYARKNRRALCARKGMAPAKLYFPSTLKISRSRNKFVEQ